MKEPRTYLRILEKTDIPTTQKWINSKEISEIMGYLPVLSLDNQYEWYDKLKNDKNRYIFAICLKDDTTHIGNVALGNIDYVNRHAMFSIFIYDMKFRYLGYGTESTIQLLDFAFENLNMNKIYLKTSPGFKSAIKMYENIGFVKEGVMRQHHFIKGKYEDKIMYSILKSEYKQK
jgi:RimJ/RimL family protein N-acetyltransferase